MEYIPFNFENFICKQNSKLQKAYIWNRLNTYDTFNVVSFWNFFNSKNLTNLVWYIHGYANCSALVELRTRINLKYINRNKLCKKDR